MSVGMETPIYDQKRTILCTTKLDFQESYRHCSLLVPLKLIDVILVVSKVGIVDLFVILHQMSASFFLKTSHITCLLKGLYYILVDFIDFLSRSLAGHLLIHGTTALRHYSNEYYYFVIQFRLSTL